MRRKFTEADRQRYLAELKDSGETPWRLARRIGITPANLYRWMRQGRGATMAFPGAFGLRTAAEDEIEVMRAGAPSG